MNTLGYPCTRPWTSLEERSLVGDWQVCCFTPTILGVIRKDADTDLLTLWNNEAIIGMRRAFIEGTFGRHCPSDCPILVRKRGHEPDHTDFYEYDPAEYATFSAEFRENRERVLDAIANRRLRVDAFPLRLKLHPSNGCNLDCRMCNLDKSLREDIGEGWRRNMWRLLPYLEEIVVFGGEPFACKTTREIVFGGELSRYPQLHFSTITNGAILDENILDRLKGLRLGWFSFSLDSCDQETYPKIRVNADHARTFANIERFVRARDTGEIRIRKINALFVVQALNYREVPRFIEWACGLRIEPVFSLVAGTPELLGCIEGVRESLEAGIETADRLGVTSVAADLRSLLRELPLYERKLRRQKQYFRVFSVIDRDSVVSFFQRHNTLKQAVRRIIGI
jgi:pyruvate-formate lyase-activating enzyme